MSYFNSNKIIPKLIGYADAECLSDSHRACSQIDNIFRNGGTIISWHFPKQFMVATSSNYSEIIVIHEYKSNSFEDNATCITQIKGGYIKGHRTKHNKLDPVII